MSVVVPPGALLEATAELIAAGPGVAQQFDAGLRGLIRLLNADRGDCGFVGPTAPSYSPAHLLAAPDTPAPTFEAPLGDPLMQTVLGSRGAFFIDDVRSEAPDGAIRDLLLGTDTRSIVVQRLDHHDDGYGLVCIDWVGRGADVPAEALELVDYFVRRIWTPLLLRAVAEGDPGPDDRLAALTSAERAVVELAAVGLSYREIARSRRTSVNTVSQQLRSARQKVGASNTAELCALVGPLPEPARSQDPAIDPLPSPGVRSPHE